MSVCKAYLASSRYPPGWVFERHPDIGIAMLEFQPGTIVDAVGDTEN